MSLHIKPEQVCRSLLGVLNRSTEWRQLKVKNRKTFYEASSSSSSSLLKLPNQMSQMEEKIAKNSSWGGGGGVGIVWREQEGLQESTAIKGEVEDLNQEIKRPN